MNERVQEQHAGHTPESRQVIEIHLREDAGGAFLEIEPPAGELRDGQWVVWKFSGVPKGVHAVPALHFDRPLGPFHTVRTAPDLHSVVGKGNAGPEAAGGLHTYHASLVLGATDAPRLVSTRVPATLNNLATRADTTPEVRVRYVPGRDGKPGELVADPFVLRLNDGDTPFWSFYDLPTEGSIYLYATDSQEGALDPLLGPFQSLTSLRVGGGATGGLSQLLVGAGQGASPAGRYTYHMRLVGPGGETLAGGDPVIDNGGPPG